MKSKLDERARVLLKTLIERYIAAGQPVGSRSLAGAPGLELSPATIRNVMSDLEDLGLIASPHTSAGRVPTPRGWRLFVDTMLTAPSGEVSAPALAAGQPQQVIASAADTLSQLSRFVGVVLAPRQPVVLRHVEFLRLSRRRLLLIIVSPAGDVQNRVLLTDEDYSDSQLQEASNYLNEHFCGMDIEQARQKLRREADTLRAAIARLMQQAVQAGSEALTQAQGELVISGERRLLDVSDFSGDLDGLRRAFDLFEQKAQLIRLLDSSSQAEGVRIFIGGESQEAMPLSELSIVSAPYEVDGRIVGTLGVIGPTRMPYGPVLSALSAIGGALSDLLGD